MAAGILFYFVLLSGSAVAACFSFSRPERMLALDMFCIIVLLYVGALLDVLRQSAYAVLLLAAALWLLVIVQTVRKKTLSTFVGRICTPGMAVFTLLYLIFLVCDAGRLVSNWDAFSHWADTVKILYHTNRLATYSMHAMFPAYPPAMSLLQYFVQVLGDTFSRTPAFCEWQLYLTFQTALVVPFVPFLTKLQWKKPLRIALAAAFVFALPLLYLREYAYNSIVVDPLLGVLAGYGMALVLWRGENDPVDAVSLILLMPVLSLCKGSGWLLALCILFVLLIDSLLFRRGGLGKDSAFVRAALLSVLCAAALAAGKLSWTAHLAATDVDAGWDSGLSLSPVMALLAGDETQRAVLVRFLKAMFVEKRTIGNLGLGLSPALSIVLLLAGQILLAMKYEKGCARKRALTCFFGATVSAGLFFIGILLVYLTKFTAHSALSAASFDRYAGTPLTMLSMLLLLAIIDRYAEVPVTKRFYAVALALFVLLAPHIYALRFLLRNNVSQSIELRAPYDAAADKIADICEKERSIRIVAQESDGLDTFIFRYLLWPDYSVSGGSYGKAFYDGDIWTKETDAASWRENNAKAADYVLLYRLNEPFYDLFADAFASGEVITPGALYRVNPADGMLTALTD